MGPTDSTRWTLIMLGIVPVAVGTLPAQAQTKKRARRADSCVVTGDAKVHSDVVIFHRGGAPLARFTGGSTPLRFGPFPGDGSARVPVATGTGSGSFRIEGFVDGQSVPLIAARDLPVVPHHVWIAAQQEVVFVGALRNKLRVRKDLHRPSTLAVTAWAACADVTLAHGVARGPSLPRHARGHVVEADPAELFAGPNADRAPVMSLAGARGMLLWSSERRGGFAHLVYRGELVINAWGRLTEFPVLDDIGDRQAAPTRITNPPRLHFEGQPRLVRTKSEVPLWNAASDKAMALGCIEADTETYVLDVVAGWAYVLPKSLAVVPCGSEQFWVKASDLGL